MHLSLKSPSYASHASYTSYRTKAKREAHNNNKKGNIMKLKIEWKELWKQLWSAIRPVLLGAIGGGIVSFSSGCSSLAPSDKTQTMGASALRMVMERGVFGSLPSGGTCSAHRSAVGRLVTA